MYVYKPTGMFVNNHCVVLSEPRPLFVYLLESYPSGRCYIGATVDLTHRLRQHNQELVGGAKRTHRHVLQGNVWTRVLHVTGFPSWNETLRFEWSWQNQCRRYRATRSHECVWVLLHVVLHMERSTKQAQPFVCWPQGLPLVVSEHVPTWTRAHDPALTLVVPPRKPRTRKPRTRKPPQTQTQTTLCAK